MKFRPSIFIFALVVFCLFIPEKGFPQNKIGSVNTQEILDTMPEMIVAKAKIDSMGNAYNIVLQQLEKQYDIAIQEGDDDAISSLQLRLYKFKDAIDSEIENESDTLFKPIRQKLQIAIHQVALDGGYGFIFDTKYDAIVLYASKRADITAIVKKKLGL